MDGVIHMIDVKKELARMSEEMDPAIRSYIKDELPENLIEACRQYPYAGGKRMRPAMVLSACGAVGGDDDFDIVKPVIHDLEQGVMNKPDADSALSRTDIFCRSRTGFCINLNVFIQVF